MQTTIVKPKLLFVLPGSVVGGAETKAFNLLRSLNSFDRVLVTQSPIRDFYSGLGIEIYTFEEFGCSQPHILSLNNILTYAKAIKKISGLEKPNIILGIMHSGTLFVTVAHDIFFLKAIPVVTIEGNISAYFKHINRPPSIKEKLLLKYCFMRAGGIIVPSEGVKEDLVNNYGTREEKVRTIHNGIDIDMVKEASKEEISYKKDCPWIVTACRLNLQKDFPTLLKAFRIVRDATAAKLFIIGDGELKGDIMKLASELRIDEDVIIPGFQKNPFTYISKADVFVLSSSFEGFGNVIVEAMALGIPVVSTDCPSGPREIIKDNENGFLVPVGGFQEMAAKCLSIFNNNSLRERISREGKKRSEDFSISAMAEGFESYMTGLLRI